MKNSVLSHRERVRLALEHKETDRIPIAMVCAGINPPAMQAFHEFLERERQTSVTDYLSPLIDIAPIFPQYTGPALDPGTDYWGVKRNSISYGSGAYDEIEEYPLSDLTLDQIIAHPWPTTDLFDYSGIPGFVQYTQKDSEKSLIIYNGNIFESSWWMRGFEQIFIDMMTDPELAHAIFRRATDFHIAHYRKILEAANGEIDLAFTADDIGGQRGLLMSLDLWEQNIKPYHVELNNAIHEYGAKVIYHTDGAVMEAVPGLIDMGIDVLQALQFDADGMDPEVLKDSYGDRLCFEGGVSVQHTLPFGTPQEVEEEVRHLIGTLGRNGGYILGPSHFIQAGTPPENIAAMFDTAASHRIGSPT